MLIELLLPILAGILVIVFANSLSRRIGVAGPLVLVAIGLLGSLIPALAEFSVPPNLVLIGVLPPLLYSAAVSAPAIEFRRDFEAIGGLSVVLVVISSLVLGLVFFWMVPGLGFPFAVALGAILSPTDAVATSMARSLGLPNRVVTVLEGESLVNDASALVILRTAIVAAASSFSLGAALGAFAWSVVVAVVIGALVGAIALWLRSRTSSAVGNTAIGFTVPYLAYVPADELGGSGLVAAVVAGLVCGQGALRWLTPEQRASDKLNWATIEFVLEGAIFLFMGLQLTDILADNIAHHEGVGRGVLLAIVAFGVVVLVRALYVMPMMRIHNLRMQRKLRARLRGRIRRSSRRIGRVHADIDYFDSSPLTWKHNTVIVWAGMRGAVTLAAAQTLPEDTPERSLLIFIAFLVATGSLLVQGLTLPLLVRWLGLGTKADKGPPHAEIREIGEKLQAAVQTALADGQVSRPDSTPFEAERTPPRSWITMPLEQGDDVSRADVLSFELALIEVMRTHLHQLGRSGWHSSSALRYVLEELDAYEIAVKLYLESERH
ncbi:MAG: sodium:proton antiporter [Microbacteriaceae bacterium]|nr:sodium:proton antiporter [Microbacteriaceae bacterium]